MATEKRLIDANALLEKVQFRMEIDNKNAEIIAGCVNIARRLIENAPTVDAVEVVRGQWIPVAERLPELMADNYEGEKIETSKYVLGYNVRGGTVERVYLEISNGVMYWVDEPGTTYKITHWMPLPEPPETAG